MGPIEGSGEFDSGAAVANAAVPSFSKGTVALDPNERRAASVETATTAVDQAAQNGAQIPLDTDDADAGATAQAAAAGRDAGAQPRERDERGQFKPAPEAKPAAAPKPATKKQQAAAEAEAAAEVDDIWADVEDMMFEHDDGTQYPVRTPKQYAKQVQRFNQRQAQVNRQITYLQKYRQTLEPLIQSGRLDAVIAPLQRALNDPEFAEYVQQAYNRRVTGMPLNIQAQTAYGPAAPGAAAAYDAPSPAQTSSNAITAESLGITDPFMAEALQPLVQQYQTMFNKLNAMEQAQQTAAQRQQQQTALRNQQEAQLRAAHDDLARQFPAMFDSSKAQNDPEWQRVWRFARDGGYFANTTDLRTAAKLAARDYMDSRAETYSPAAELLAQAERASLNGAKAQAAAARSVGGGAASPAPRQAKPAPPQPPSSLSVDPKTGKRISAKEHMAALQQYAAQLAAYQAQA